MSSKTIYHITVGDIETNCWIYPLNIPSLEDADNSNEQAEGYSPCVVIDPGAEGSRIAAFLDQHKLFPQYILLTHGHFDHIGAVPFLAKKYSKAGIAIHSADAEYLGPDSYQVHCRSFSIAVGNTAYIDALWEDMPSPSRTLAEGDIIGPFTVLHLPGHSPGSVGFWDKKADILFSGDTLFDGNYGRTDLPGGNEKQLFASLKRLFTLDSLSNGSPPSNESVASQKGDIQVYPGHGPSTSIKAARSIMS
jgi:glyoxylase-like metal-dependent hydrolase (beta-lactamase superfamily II)